VRDGAASFSPVGRAGKADAPVAVKPLAAIDAATAVVIQKREHLNVIDTELLFA